MHKIVATSLVALVALTGCSSENLFYQHEGGVRAPQQSGVALNNGDSAQVGMSGTTCDVMVEDGAIGTDYDYPGDIDRVEDFGEDPVEGGGVVVVTSDKGVHVQQDDGWFTGSSDYDMPDVTDAVLTGDAVVVAQTGGSSCDVTYVHTDQPVRAELNDSFCDGPTELAGDPTSSGSYLGTSAGVVKIDPEAGTVEVIDSEPAEIIAWDAAADVLYTASIGGSTVTALEGDGSLRWSTDVDGTILDITDNGDAARALVSVDLGDGSGELVFLDGYTGLFVDSKPLWEPAEEVYSDRGGQRIAITRGDDVDFYNRSMWSF